MEPFMGLDPSTLPAFLQSSLHWWMSIPPEQQAVILSIAKVTHATAGAVQAICAVINTALALCDRHNKKSGDGDKEDPKKP
jgi:hypothetical protein